jgi:hypothetical protein
MTSMLVSMQRGSLSISFLYLNHITYTLLCWIHKLHKCLYKKRNIAGSAKCSTKPFLKLLTLILRAVKTGFGGIVTLATQRVVWIKCGFRKNNSRDLLEYIQSGFFSSCYKIKTLKHMTSLHYTTIPYSKLKGRLKELIQLCFIKMNVPVLVHFVFLPLMYR